MSDYNRTTDSANKTVATLLRILKSFDVDSSQEESDPLMDIINGAYNNKHNEYVVFFKAYSKDAVIFEVEEELYREDD